MRGSIRGEGGGRVGAIEDKDVSAGRGSRREGSKCGESKRGEWK